MNKLDLIAVAGIAAIEYGLWIVHPSAMWIGGGVMAVGLAVVIRLGKGRK